MNDNCNRKINVYRRGAEAQRTAEGAAPLIAFQMVL